MYDSHEDQGDELPNAIYFDTSAMRDVGHALRKGWMENIRAVAQRFSIDLCLPELVLNEWIWLLWQECLKSISDCENKSRFLSELIGVRIEIPSARQDTRLEQLLRRHASRLKEAGFILVSTAKLELNDLLNQAISHVAPFQPQDRGFRDAVILESIASHAIKSYEQPDILVISFDKGFQRGCQRFTAKGVKGDIVTPSDCERRLEQKRVAAVGRLLVEGDPALNAFLQQHKERIFCEVRRARVSLSTIKGGLIGVPPEDDPLHNAIVRSINAIHPVSVGRCLPGTKPIFGEIATGRQPINFEVGIDVDLTIERSPMHLTSLLGPEIPLDRPVDVDPYWRSPDEKDPIIEDVRVRRTVHVDASVAQEQGASEEYRDLQIHQVW